MVSKLKRLPTEWEKNLCLLYIWQVINNKCTQAAQKTKLPKTKWPNEKNGQMNQTKLLQRKKSKWLKSTWRNAQHLCPLRKYKSKPW
jgi:hypothetical protein